MLQEDPTLIKKVEWKCSRSSMSKSMQKKDGYSGEAGSSVSVKEPLFPSVVESEHL